MKNILIAPNAYKGALDASKAADAIEQGLILGMLNGSSKKVPIADGGDGSLSVISHYLGATLHTKRVTGPLGKPVAAQWGFNESTKTAVIELAEASGIRLLRKEELSAWETTTYGTGELIREAVAKGAKTIYLTIGGSATVDGALGILDALGTIFYTENEQLIDPGARDMEHITRIDISSIPEAIRQANLIILCDVTNPLLGDEGAASVFAPQKGALVTDVSKFEKGFENLASLIKKDFGKQVGDLKHGGAAGGVSAILHGVLGAKLIAGGEQILEWADFNTHLKWADVVITGEGRIDHQTQYGKGPGLVAMKAKEAGKFVIGLSGFVEPDDLTFGNFDVILSLSNKPDSLENAMSQTAVNLKRLGYQLGKLLDS